jgi:hypothetical protein
VRVSALRGQYRQYVVARLLAAPAHVRADAAMLMVVCMPLTLLPADAARLGASLHDQSREFRLELGLPAQDLARGSAHITTVQTQADAADQHAYVVLAEVSVGASSTALRAVEARLDACKQRPGLDRASPGMRLQYLLSMGHDHLPSFARADSLPLPDPGQGTIASRPSARTRRAHSGGWGISSVGTLKRARRPGLGCALTWRPTTTRSQVHAERGASSRPRWRRGTRTRVRSPAQSLGRRGVARSARPSNANVHEDGDAIRRRSAFSQSRLSVSDAHSGRAHEARAQSASRDSSGGIRPRAVAYRAHAAPGGQRRRAPSAAP